MPYPDSNIQKQNEKNLPITWLLDSTNQPCTTLSKSDILKSDKISCSVSRHLWKDASRRGSLSSVENNNPKSEPSSDRNIDLKEGSKANASGLAEIFHFKSGPCFSDRQSAKMEATTVKASFTRRGKLLISAGLWLKHLVYFCRHGLCTVSAQWGLCKCRHPHSLSVLQQNAVSVQICPYWLCLCKTEHYNKAVVHTRSACPYPLGGWLVVDMRVREEGVGVGEGERLRDVSEEHKKERTVRERERELEGKSMGIRRRWCHQGCVRASEWERKERRQQCHSEDYMAAHCTQSVCLSPP